MHGRHEQRAVAGVARLHAAGGHALPVWGNFAQLAQVVTRAREVIALTGHLDVLINNAGQYAQQRSMTLDGFELSMGAK